MFGHTHMKTLSKSRGVITLNPGSIGKPRDGSYSYAILDESGISLIDAESCALLERLEYAS